MRILDRYIIKGFVFPFVWCLAVFIFLYIIIDLFGHLDDVLNAYVGFNVLYRYYLCFIPLIFVQTTPIAMLLATIYLLGSLVKHNEITAMRANGIGLWRLLQPFLFLGLAMSLLVFIANERIVPFASLNAEEIKEQQIKKVKIVDKEKKVENVTLYGEGNRLFYGAIYEVGRNLLKDITILEHNKDMQPISKITASYAKWSSKGKWKLYDCIVHSFTSSSASPLSEATNQEEISLLSPEAGPKPEPLIRHYEEMTLDIKEKPEDFLKPEGRAEFMNYQGLKGYIERLSGGGKEIIRNLKVELYYKLSFPLISLIVLLIGIPFSLTPARTGTLRSIGICIAISLLYYAVTAVGIGLGKGGMLPPLVSAWMGNIVFGTAGVVLLGRIRM